MLAVSADNGAIEGGLLSLGASNSATNVGVEALCRVLWDPSAR
jgi:hypothetical protein